MKRRLVLGMVGLLLAGCGATATPGPDSAATQTRATEVAQVQGLQTQVAAPTNTPPRAPATATIEPINTIMPTTTIKATPTPAPTPVPTSAPTMTATPSGGKVGERIASRDVAVTINEVRDPLAPGQYLAPKPGSRWVAFDVTVENAASKPRDYNLYFTRIKTADSREYQPAFVDADIQPLLQSGTQQPGEATRGWIAFEIPEGAQLATFTYGVNSGSSPVTVGLR